ncbi:MAG: DUF2127 domain-containing protein [Candidatus Doudnabacteria bacterium]|nr:DUF2127 domain-containing protein [Candidatus Doudnabacteria bacterium]
MTAIKTFFHKAFEASIVIKLLFALLEFFGAALLLVVHPTTIGDWIIRITSIGFESGDLVYKLAANAAYYFVGHTQTFVVFYLASHGVVKIFVLFCLWRKKLWAYPLAEVMFVGFGIYQMYRWYLTGSEIMIWLTVLDILVIWLTWLEYKNLKHDIMIQS